MKHNTLFFVSNRHGAQYTFFFLMNKRKYIKGAKRRNPGTQGVYKGPPKKGKRNVQENH